MRIISEQLHRNTLELNISSKVRDVYQVLFACNLQAGKITATSIFAAQALKSQCNHAINSYLTFAPKEKKSLQTAAIPADERKHAQRLKIPWECSKLNE